MSYRPYPNVERSRRAALPAPRPRSRRWNSACNAPNYSDRCELPAGHEGRHKDGIMSWPQGVKRPVTLVSGTGKNT